MLRDERPDIVSICTPDETHGRIISDTLRSPGLRAVLAEKPLATDLRKAETIAREARKRHISLAVNYTRRFDPVHHGIRAAVQNGLIGEIQTIIGNYSKGTLHNGTHLFDLARFLIGEIISVRGFQRLEDSDTDPTIDAFLMFQSGASGFFHACDESAFTIFEADIIGTRGRIQFLESGHIIRKYTVADDPFYSGYRALALESTRTDGMHNVLLHAVEDLAGSIAEGREPLCTGEDAVTALRIAFALRKSARQNGRLQHVITHENSAASRLKKDG
jgi:predicted dehydrogenase